MTRLLAVFILSLLMIVPVTLTQAQNNPEDDTFTINFEEIRRGLFLNSQGDTYSETWLLDNISQGDVPIITVSRISGQFIPAVRLLNKDGTELSNSAIVQTFDDTIQLSYEQGLSVADAPYSIEVSARDVITIPGNPVEYSLSLRRYGTRRSHRDAGIVALPVSVDSDPLALPQGEAQNIEGVIFNVFGNSATVENGVLQSTTSELSIDISDAAGILSISMLDTGIGLTVGNSNIGVNANRPFFSDESFIVSFVDELNEYTFTMASGMQIKTTFERIESIVVQDGVAVFRIPSNGGRKRLIFDNAFISVQNNDNGNFGILYDQRNLTINPSTIDIFASYNGEHRIYAGDDARLVSRVPLSFITGNDATGRSEIFIRASSFSEDRADDDLLTLNLDWSWLSDIFIDGENVYYDTDNAYPESVDEIEAIEPLETLVEVLTDDGAVQFRNEIFESLTFRRVYPDGTVINTRTEPSSNFNILPWQTGSSTRNYNNLGADILPSCPCSSEIQAHTPINPANGNFFYHVTDFSIFTPDLPLSLSRYYNSYDNRVSQGFATDSRLSPRYFSNESTNYARFGNGWRHSYQYELDITHAPQERISFIEPDGTGHYFMPAPLATDPPELLRWTSRTLQSIVIFREGGELGSWRAETTDGLQYHFDRAGRLARINYYGQSTILTASPQEYQTETGMSGTFIVEPYGRRLELYIGDSQRIELVRSFDDEQIRYSYDDTNSLVSVDYGNSSPATYAYDSLFGLLSSYNDIRSPYTQIAEISYYEDQSEEQTLLRVASFNENPGDLQRQYIFNYLQDENNNYITRRSLVISENVRPIQQWTYNDIWQLQELRLPGDSGNYQFGYDDIGNLVTVRLPMGVNFRLQYDSAGNLIRFTEPIVVEPDNYGFSYSPHGETGTRSLLTTRTYPDEGLERYTWETNLTTGAPYLLSREIFVSGANQNDLRITRHEYDDAGRLIRLIEPGNIAREYQYDEMGYLSEIREGINLNISDDPERVTNLSYNLRGQLTTITDSRGVTYMIEWDDATGQIESVTGPYERSIEYSYNERGLVVTANDRGQITGYTYNGLDLLTGILRADGGTQTFDYDPAGNLLNIIEDVDETTQLTTSYQYDASGNLILQRLPSGLISRYETTIDASGFIERRQFDPTGRIITQRYNASGQLIRLLIDDEESFNDENIAAIQDFLLSYNNGNLVSILETSVGTRPITYAYNLAGDVTGLEISSGENRASTRFAYDERGLLSQVTAPGEMITRYTYDPSGNIATVTRPGNPAISEADIIWQYEYNDSINLSSVIDPAGITTIYVSDGQLNQLESIFSLVSDSTTTYSYDGRGNLENINIQRDANTSISTIFSYDALDRPLSFAIEGVESEIIYTYDFPGRLETINREDASNPIRITYDDDGNIIAISDEGESRTLYSYDGSGRVTSITDSQGRTTSYEYNIAGQVTEIRDALGNSQNFTWSDSTGYLEGYTDISGQVYTINSDYLGRITRVLPQFTPIDNQVVPPALDTGVRYNAAGYITGMTIGNSLNYNFEYNNYGNITRYLDATGGEWILTYNDAGQLTEVRNPRNIIMVYEYNDAGLVSSVENYAGTESAYTENFGYYPNGTVSRYSIPDVIRYEYTYNASDLLARVVIIDPVTESPLATYSYEYNAFGRITQIIEPGGRTQEFTYPSSSPLNLQVFKLIGTDTDEDNNPPELAIRYDYDGAENLSSIRLPVVGQREDINITYDALNRRVRYVNGEDNSWAYTYDNSGNIIQISDPLGSAVSYTYDQYNRITDISYPSGNPVKLNYGENGNLQAITLPPNTPGNSSSAQRIEYDLNNVGWIDRFQMATDYVSFTYDPMGNVLSRTTPDGIVTHYSYDPAGRLQSMTYADDGTIHTYAYDEQGNLISVGDLNFAYDSLRRMTEASGSTIPSITYAYDPVSGNVAVRDAGDSGITAYNYDALYRPEQIDFNGQSIHITYDARGRIRNLIRGNILTRITYNQNNRITVIENGRSDTLDINNLDNAILENLDLINYEYDAVGNLINVSREQSNDFILSEVSYSYDIDQRLISERWLDANSETFYVVAYEYDATGNRILEDRNGHITSYDYNDQNQLIEEHRNVLSDGQQLFLIPGLMLMATGAFVLRRRRRWLVIPLVTGLFVSITFAQGGPAVIVSYEYDINGNMTLISYQSTETFTLDFDYDRENRLSSVQGSKIAFNENNDAIGIPVDTHYTYDEFSRIVSIQTLDASYTLYYDGHTLLGMTELDENGEESDFRYLNFQGQNLLTLREDSEGNIETLWNLNDRMGSTRRYADANGNLLEDLSLDYEFESFGRRIFPRSPNFEASSVAVVNEPVQFFGGQLYDPSTELYLIGLRAYDPAIGRFLQPDPVRQDPVGNLYTYARNRPLTFRDPTGMMVEPVTAPLSLTRPGSDLNPDNFIAQPYQPPIPDLQQVNRLQEDEFFRLLQLQEVITYGLNDSMIELSPYLDEIYILEINPAPDELRTLIAEPLDRTMAMYESGEGWIPDPRPDPTIAHNPFDILSEIAPVIRDAYANPSGYNSGVNPAAMLPSVDVPQAMTSRGENEQLLPDLLQPVQTGIVFENQIDLLLDSIPPDNLPQIALPTVALPSAQIEPPVMDNLDALREQTYAFYSRIWTIGQPDCEDCVPPLGFSQ